MRMYTRTHARSRIKSAHMEETQTRAQQTVDAAAASGPGHSSRQAGSRTDAAADRARTVLDVLGPTQQPGVRHLSHVAVLMRGPAHRRAAWERKRRP